MDAINNSDLQNRISVRYVSASEFAQTHPCDPDWVALMGEKLVPVLPKGLRGTTSGYEATVLEHYRNGMYEVRTPGGLTCISASDFDFEGKASLVNSPVKDMEAFRSTAQKVEDLGAITGCDGDMGKPGIVYAGGCFIYDESETHATKFHLVLGRDEFESHDLAHLEKILYEQWYVRECVDQRDHPEDANGTTLVNVVEDATNNRSVSLTQITLTFSLPDDFGKGWDYEVVQLYSASHSWAGSYEKTLSGNFAHLALMQVQGVRSSYLSPGWACNVDFTVNDIAEAAAIQTRLQDIVDAFENRPERNISVRGSNFYDYKVTEYDANDPENEIVSDMPYLNYLARYVPLAEKLHALSGHDLKILRTQADEHQRAKLNANDDSPIAGA